MVLRGMVLSVIDWGKVEGEMWVSIVDIGEYGSVSSDTPCLCH